MSEERSEVEIDLHCHDGVVTDSVRINRNPRERVRRTGQAYCVSLKKNFDKGSPGSQSLSKNLNHLKDLYFKIQEGNVIK